jgi:DNA primase
VTESNILFSFETDFTDADSNGSGQRAARSLGCRLGEHGVNVRIVSLPENHDPNSFFVQGGDARQFQSLLEAAQS